MKDITNTAVRNIKKTGKARGQSLTEYSLILGGILLAAWGALALLGGSISNQLTGISGELGDKNASYLAEIRFDGSNGQSAYPNGGGLNGNGEASTAGLQNTNSNGQPVFGSNGGELTLHDANGGGTNASSAEGSSVNMIKSLAQTATIAQSLKELADLTQNPNLGGLSQQALMSASVQASYQIITYPDNPANAQLQGLKQVATANHTDAELAGNPGRILSSIEQWNRRMQTGREEVLRDNQLTANQKAEAVALLDQIIGSTRQTYGAERLSESAKNTPELRVANFVDKTETFIQLREEAKKALASNLDNETLKSTLQGGVALDPKP